MNTRTEGQTTGGGHIDCGAAVAAARPLSDFAHERVGDDLVIFDGETMQYHTLNGVAAKIWRACDGAASIEAIAQSMGLPVEVVATTIGELGEASLLQTPASAWSVGMNRRRAAKLIAAGAAGAIGVPVVLSLTAPSHQAAASGFRDCVWPEGPSTTGCKLDDVCVWERGEPQSVTVTCCQATGHPYTVWAVNCADV